jgi:hypothetical protein
VAWRTLLIVVVAALAAAPARAEDASRATAVRRQVGDRQVVVQRNGAVEVTVAGAKVEGRLSPEERSGLGAALKGLDVAALQAKLDELRADEAAPEVTIELVGLSDWSSTFVLPPSARAVRAGFAALEKVLDAVEARVAREAAAATVQRRGRLVPHEGGLALEADGARVVLGGETAATLQRLGESAWREVELLGRLERRAAGIERLVVDGARCRGVTVSGTLARASDGTLHLGNGVALGKPAADRRLAWFDGLVGHPLRVQGDLLVKGAAAKFAPGFKQLDRLEEELDWTTRRPRRQAAAPRPDRLALRGGRPGGGVPEPARPRDEGPAAGDPLEQAGDRVARARHARRARRAGRRLVGGPGRPRGHRGARDRGRRGTRRAAGRQGREEGPGRGAAPRGRVERPGQRPDGPGHERGPLSLISSRIPLPRSGSPRREDPRRGASTRTRERRGAASVRMWMKIRERRRAGRCARSFRSLRASRAPRRSTRRGSRGRRGPVARAQARPPNSRRGRPFEAIQEKSIEALAW